MSRIFKTITKMFGSAPVHEYQAKPRPVGSSVEIDAEATPPQGSGWKTENGHDFFRIIKIGPRTSETTKTKRRTGLTKRPRE